MKKYLLCLGLLSLVNFVHAKCDDPAKPSVNWIGCNKAHESFIDASLMAADLKNANLMSTNFTDSTLEAADLISANLDYTNFTNTILELSDLSNAIGESTIFISADLEYANLKKAKLINADFSSAYLVSATFDGANLTGANFTNANLANTKFIGANLANAKGIEVKFITFVYFGDNTYLKNANLSNAHIINDSDSDVVCGKASFWRKFVMGEVLGGANLSGAILGDGKQCKENSIGCCKL